MTRRRIAPNPARMKAEIEALEASPPAEPFHRPLDIRRRLSLALLCLLSSFLLLISFAPFDCGPVGYLALVPLGLAAVGARKGRWVLLWVYLGGVAFWAAGLYWLTWMAVAGYVPLVLYLGAYWVVAAAVVRKAFARGLPVTLVLPVVWVALEYARAFALSGFTWFYLAHSQYRWTRLIQVCDLTGQYGVSFFVAMVNGALIDAFAQPLFRRARGGRGRITWRIAAGAGACLASAAALLAYGGWRLGQEATRPGPRVGLVQLAFPISLAGDHAEPEEIFRAHRDNTGALVGAGCDLIVWPESMVGYPHMDPAVWAHLNPRAVDKESRPVYDAPTREAIEARQRALGELRDLIKDAGCPLLAGGSMPAVLWRCLNCGKVHRGPELPEECPACGGPKYRFERVSRWQCRRCRHRHVGPEPPAACPACGAPPEQFEAEYLRGNSALLFDRDEQNRLRLRTRYDKVHLVPFSECVPFRDGWPWFHRQLRRFVPEVMRQLEPGGGAVWFQVSSGGEEFCFAVPICYEGTFARVCRRLVISEGAKRADMLVNISNDGWFVRKYAGGRKVHAGTELAQHLTQYVFRAVECRVPVLRAVNTGISAHVNSSGEILQQVSRRGKREMVAGNLVAETFVDRRTSGYSKHGDLFAQAVSVAAGAVLVGVFWPRRGKE